MVRLHLHITYYPLWQPSPPQGFGAATLKPLTALQQLRVLNLHGVHCADDEGVAAWLVSRLPRLRVLNMPASVLVR